MTEDADRTRALEAENEALRAEVERLREQVRLLQAFVDHTPALMFVKDLEGRYILANKQTARFLGRTPEEVLGRRNSDFLAPEQAEASTRAELRAAEQGSAQVVLRHERPDGVHYMLNVKFPVPGEDGTLLGTGTLAVDVTREQRAEEERAALQSRMIAAQEATIRELTTPLLPIAEKVVAMPIVGNIDDQRAEQIMENLLAGITQHGASVAILDITGVKIVDTAAAHALVQAARAASLLGARVVLTGTSAMVAQTLVDLGVDLGDIITLATLRGGIAYALRQRQSR
jgi:anti-anti-sigma factor